MASVQKREGYGFEVRYIDPSTGKRRSKTCKLKKEADAFKRKVEREIEDGVHVAATETRTVAQALAATLDVVDERQQAGAIGKVHASVTRRISERDIMPALGKVVLRDLTRDQVEDFARTLRNKGCAPKTVRKYLLPLKAMETLARRRGWLKTLPVSDALADQPKQAVERIDTFVPDEVTALLSRCVKHPAQRTARMLASTNVAIHLAALCGLRMGEIIGLPVAAIDLDLRRIHVRQAMSRAYEIKGPKSAAGHRIVPVPHQVVSVLRDWLETYHVVNDLGLLLTSATGAALLHTNLQRRWVDTLEASSLRRRHFHALRHFYASWHIANGTPGSDVAKLLGHSHFDTTLRIYTHALMPDDAKAAQADMIASLLIRRDARETQKALTH